MFIIQTPGTEELLNELNTAAKGASKGGAAFAFASKSGVVSFFKQPHISRLATNGKLELVVGIDATTNADTLFELRDQIKSLKGLTVKVFYHEKPFSIFHPKFSWFQSDRELTLVTGSGNLTHAGLGISKGPREGNWEAFTVTPMNGEQADYIVGLWSEWFSSSIEDGTLRPIDDPDVESKAVSNNRVRPSKAKAPTPSEEKVLDDSGGTIPSVIIEGTEYSDEVQVSEISRNRWPQADLGKGVVCDFFGFDEEQPDREILIQHVNLDGSLSLAEKRHLFRNKSSNYRFELGAGRGLSYATSSNNDRPVVIFVKLGGAAYRYHLVMPDSPVYLDTLNLLGRKKTGASRPMRKRLINIELLINSCPGLPAQLIPITSEDTDF